MDGCGRSWIEYHLDTETLKSRAHCYGWSRLDGPLRSSRPSNERSWNTNYSIECHREDTGGRWNTETYASTSRLISSITRLNHKSTRRVNEWFPWSRLELNIRGLRIQPRQSWSLKEKLKPRIRLIIGWFTALAMEWPIHEAACTS